MFSFREQQIVRNWRQLRENELVLFLSNNKVKDNNMYIRFIILSVRKQNYGLNVTFKCYRYSGIVRSIVLLYNMARLLLILV